MRIRLSLAMIVATALSGCVTTGTDGVVPIGPDMYMIGGLGEFTDFSASAVKARMFKQAAVFCAGQGRVMSPMGSTGKDSGYGTYASAEVQFRCLAPDATRPGKYDLARECPVPAGSR